MTHHIIYVPGLGDRRTYGQNLIIQLWRLYGFEPHYFPLHWNSPDGYEAKSARLQAYIDSLAQHGDQVSLVGTSAGASAVINAYVASGKISGLVYISGKINRPETVSPKLYERNPDFKESLFLLQKNITKLSSADKQRMLSIHPWRDSYVPPKDTAIPGVAEHVVPGWGHRQGIFIGLTLGVPKICGFLRSCEHKTSI